MILRRRFVFSSSSQPLNPMQALADRNEISLALHLFLFCVMQSVYADENRQSTRIRQWRLEGTWDTGMSIAAWFGQPHERQEGGGGDADVPAHAFPFETDVPALPPRSSLCRSTSKERSLVVGLLINFPVTVV